ncbi:putative quinol monooxygenase [uncultured Pseudokineococcus sp.]|uniref:putative quinol monooxygenase n=1 Tax=uncultured Pseudokineococcus sp. TaxID=1642928 RepID=UPI0026065208|nr:putative quinol monooxygenase [uncultured Pseudokineococcus sp.]
MAEDLLTSGDQPGAFPPGSFVLWATLQVREDRVEEFLAGIADDARCSLRDEPGCLGFTVHRDAADPLRFHFHEVYVSREAFEVDHRGSAHFARWDVVSERTVIKADLVFSEVVALP